MKTTSLALTDSRIRLATVVFPDPVPPEIPIIKLTTLFDFPTPGQELTSGILKITLRSN